MSILIKDENMPESCGHCWLLVSGTDVNGKPEYECVLTEEKRAFEELFRKRGEWCPLVEIPPHGELIDRNKLLKSLEREWNVSDDTDFANKIVWNITETAPTVIESEEQENE